MFRAAIAALCVLLIGLVSITPAQPAKGKKHALLIGITEYKHANLPTLKYPENDVEGMAEILESKAGGFTSVKVLSVSRAKKFPKLAAPTKANIEKAIENLLAAKGKEDTVLIAFAGHGVQLDVEDPDGKKPVKTYRYFCPSDADFARVSYSTGKAPKLIHIDRVFEQLAECGAGTRLVFIDACRNTTKAESSTRNLDLQKLTIPVGVGAMFSCKAGEVAWESSKFGKNGHGAFFHFVLEGLRGGAKNDKGEVRFSRLAEYVAEQVSEQVPKVIGGGAKQTPNSASNLAGQSPVLTLVSPEVVKKDDPKKEKVKKKKEKTENVDSLFERGRDLLNGSRSVKIHEAKAVAALKKASEAKHPTACAMLARCYSMAGRGTLSDRAEAERLTKLALDYGLEKRAASGDADALVELGWMHMNSFAASGVLKREPKQAFDSLQKAADKGHPEAMYWLALCHRMGRGTERSEAEYARWVKRSAEKGFAQSQMPLYFHHLRGDAGFPKDPALARKHLDIAVERHFSPALVELANRHLRGDELVKKDEKKAVELLQMAVEQKGGSGEYALGRCYRDGIVVAKDDRKALELFRYSAKVWTHEGTSAFAEMVYSGRGFDKKDEAELRKEAIERLEERAKGGGITKKGYLNWIEKLKK